MSDNPQLLCQLRAWTEYAITRHHDVDLLTIWQALQDARLAVEAEMVWRQIDERESA